MDYKPRVFIGSSTTAEPLASELADLLKSVAECMLWSEGEFRPGRLIIEELEKKARSEADFAVLILTPDDERNRGKGLLKTPRDNILFELGLFMGALGRERTFGLECEKCEIDVPTDLLGIKWLKFRHLCHKKKTFRKRNRDLIRAGLLRPADELIEAIRAFRPQPVKVAGAEEIVTAYPKRSFIQREKWNDIIRGAHGHLWLYGMAESGYAKDDQVPAILKAKAEEGCDIRILLLDPEAEEIVAAIDREEKKAAGTLRGSILDALARFGAMRSACGESLSIRLYRTKPQVSIVRGDDDALITHYVRFLEGNNAPTFEMRRMRENGIFQRYVAHFQIVWEEAQPWPA